MSIAFPIPVTCEHCGNVFASPFAVTDEGDVSFKGVSVGPCPNCGKSSMIPEGVYKASAKLGAILFARELPRQAAGNLLKFLKKNFKSYQVGGPNWGAAGATWTVVDPKAPQAHVVAKPEDWGAAEKIAEKIASEVPGVKKENIFKVATQYDLGPGTLISILIAALALYEARHPPTNTNTSTSTNANRPVPTIVQRKEHAKPKTHRRSAPKLGRNDPCSCKSGKKAKKCHPELCK